MKVLVFATNSFPYGKSEPLIADQIDLLAEEFDQIFIISSEYKSEINYDLPSNIKCYNIDHNLTFFQKFLGLFSILSKIVIEEIIYSQKKQGLKNTFKLYKVMLNYLTISKKYSTLYNKIIAENNLTDKQVYFRSYWCTEATLGFCLLKDKHLNFNLSTRVHAYDLYVERHDPQYLPFRKFIHEKINHLFFISEQGFNYYNSKYQFDQNKMSINRLGVWKKVQEIENKNINNGIKIVSCSSVIGLKRLELIVESLFLYNGSDMIEWIHFGEGNESNTIKSLINEKLKSKNNVSVIWMGFVENAEIQSYYANNHVDLFVNVSKYEGIPISMMEAMCYSIPCIGTNVGGVSEIIQNQKNGFLLNPNFSPNELTSLFFEYLNFSKGQKDEYRKNAQDTWKTKFHGDYNHELLNESLSFSYKQCSKCLYDNNIYPEISFNSKGVCSICSIYDDLAEKNIPEKSKAASLLTELIENIKKDGAKNKYDCLIGVSGGVDSTYVAYLAKEWGLNPLVLHVDNGWNSELATKNIENIIQKLGFDLHTEVLEWDEIRDLQLAFLKASVVDIDLPFDNTIMAITYKIAKKYKIKHILSGINTVTEGWMPTSFSHFKQDSINIKAIHRQFGKIKLKKFELANPIGIWKDNLIYGIKFHSPLELVDYNKAKVKQILINQLNWRDYGGKHYENIFTKFYQGYILKEKFHFDKRISHLSTLICSGQISKNEALKEYERPAYNSDEIEEDKEYFAKKIGVTLEEFDTIMKLPAKKHTDYPSYINWINKLRNIKRKFIN